METRYWSITGFRLRMFVRLYWVICLLVPKGFKVDVKLGSTETFRAYTEAEWIEITKKNEAWVKSLRSVSSD
jgi:hypothetical protein